MSFMMNPLFSCFHFPLIPILQILLIPSRIPSHHPRKGSEDPSPHRFLPIGSDRLHSQIAGTASSNLHRLYSCGIVPRIVESVTFCHNGFAVSRERGFVMRRMNFVVLVPCLMAAVLAGCASNPRLTSHPSPHPRFQHFEACYLKPLYLLPPLGCVRNSVAGAEKIERELEEHLRVVFPSLTVVKDESALPTSSSRALVIEPIIEKLKFVPSRITARAAFSGSSFVSARINFLDLSTGKIIASPVLYRKASGGAGVFSMAATDHIMLSRVVWDAFDYVTKGAVPEDAIPPGTDPRTVDPSEADLAETVSAYPKAGSQEALVAVLFSLADKQTRLDALAQLTDQKLIAKVARESRDSGLRLAAVETLTDQVVLRTIAIDEVHWKVRLAAVERLTAADVLATVAAKDRVVAVRKAAKSRLALL